MIHKLFLPSQIKSSQPHNSSYVPGIDGLRAIAILSVFIFHLIPSLLPGGFCGVDVFFVISGYVVSSSLSRDQQSTFLRFALNFYARRIVRIYPALLLFLVLIGLLNTLIVPASWLSDSTNNTALFAFFGISNYALVWFNDGYFSPRADFNPFTHTWTLAVEEQFYLFFPIVFFLWLKSKKKSGPVNFFSVWLLIILLALSLLYAWYETATSPDHAYFLLPSRFWELACGAMLFRLHTQGKFITRTKLATNLSVTFGLALVCFSFIFADPNSFPFPWAMLPVAGSLLVISGAASITSNESTANKVLINGVMVYLGKLSYSLYLWHWPIFVMFNWTIGLESPLAIICATILTMLMSMISYHLIEKPVRQSTYVYSRPDWYVISGGFAIIALCFLFLSHGVFNRQSYLSLSVTKDTHNWYPHAYYSNANKGLLPMAFKGRRMFVLGDSHTGAYSTMLNMLTDEQGVTVLRLSKTGCSIANLLGPASPDCMQFIQQSIFRIKQVAKPGDIVFLASLRMNRLGNQWDTFNESEVVSNQASSYSADLRSIALREAEAIVTSLEDASLIVMIDAPKPIFKSPAFRCSDWFNINNPTCKSGLTMNKNFLLEFRKPVMESLHILKDKHPNLLVWDTFPSLCPTNSCSAFDGKLPLFFDGDHLSGNGNRVLYPSFLSTLKTVW